MLAEAHRLGGSVAGHLCSIGYSEAVNMGIDNIEHGFLLDTEFNPSKVSGSVPFKLRHGTGEYGRGRQSDAFPV